MKNSNRELATLSLAMTIFGTIGIFVNFINLPSGFIAFTRGVIGVAFLLLFMLITRKPFSLAAVKSNLAVLVASGALIGFNWILLFESYKYNEGAIATTTLCYNMTPVFVILASPLVLRERLTLKKLLCVLISLVGVVAVAGIFEDGFGDLSELRGVLFGLGAACLYSAAVLLNKKLHGISAYEKTATQLAIAAAVVLPYTLLAEDLASASFDTTSLLHLLVVGVIHTGLAYTLYFGSMGGLPAQTVAIFSYIDPVVAILLSALLLKQELGFFDILGAVLILGATLASELQFGKRSRTEEDTEKEPE